MENLSKTGLIFYGVATAEMGLHTIYYRDFPYMLLPADHAWIYGLASLVYISGILLFLAGAAIVFEIKTRTISLLLGGVLLLIFCFYFIPYELMTGASFGEWENAVKELALAGGAFVISGCHPAKNENPLTDF